MHEAPKNFKRKRYLNEEKEQQTNQTERLHRWQKSHRSPVPNVKIGFNFTHEPIETVQRHVRSWNSHCSPLCTFGHWAYDDHDHVVCDLYIATWFLFIPCLRLDFCLSFLPFTVFRTVFFSQGNIKYLCHRFHHVLSSLINRFDLVFSIEFHKIIYAFFVFIWVHCLPLWCCWRTRSFMQMTSESTSQTYNGTRTLFQHIWIWFRQFFFASRCSFPIHLIFAPNSPANKVGWVLSWTDLNRWFIRVPNILFSFLFYYRNYILEHVWVLLLSPCFR